MRKTNYNMERQDRERANQAKAAAKTQKRAAKGGEPERQDDRAQQDNAGPSKGEPRG
jgi:hypothetical protein